MKPEPAMPKFFLVSALTCILFIANLFTGGTVHADRGYNKHRDHEVCHTHWHRHHRDSAHRHRHCHHHDHEIQGRRHGHYDDDDRRDHRREDDDRIDDTQYRDEERHSSGGTAVVPVPAPPHPPTPWGIAKSIGRTVHFSDSDRHAIKRYYGNTARRLQMMAPPSPPPGIDNLARRGAILPPAVKVRGLPSSLKNRLGALPSSHKYGHIGRIVIIYNDRTRIIKDVRKAF